MKLSEVPRYVKAEYGRDISRQTVYNWIKFGVADRLLPTVPNMPVLLVDSDDVRDFVEQLPQ